MTDVHVLYDNSTSGHYAAIFATELDARLFAERQVADWSQDKELWADEPPEERPKLHLPTWSWEPDPGLPEVFHERVPEDSYVLVGRYCVDEPTWYFKIKREAVKGIP